jgi:prepilin-type N-terminal cleavage/methylation domain-containing protein
MIHSPNAANRSFRRFAAPPPVSNPMSGATAGLSSSAMSGKTLLDKPAVAPRGPRGFTLIEMLVALAATLLMMGATVTLFGVIVDSVSGSRSLLEISDKLRATRNRIQADLQGATATMRPPLRPENDEGYLEIVEGPNFDGASNIPPGGPINTLFGDTDDALLLTVRSRGEPFVGKFPGTGTVESQVAEVLYFLKQDGPIIDATTSPPLRLCTLYRRALLVVPGQQVVVAGGTVTDPLLTVSDFYNNFDVSARVEGVTLTRVANTLGDLTKPENRIGHQPIPGPAFPFRFPTNINPALGVDPLVFIGTRLGDDILMTNVLSFDVQVYDPGAPVFVSSGVAVEPRDQGFADRINNSATVPPVATGAYADLGYLFQPAITSTYTPPIGFLSPIFGGRPSPMSGYPTVAPFPQCLYDTWSLHYENNGMNNAGIPGLGDLATNGLDDDGAAGVDNMGESNRTNGIDDDGNGAIDDGESDTLPPYSAPLRGVRITIRVYEPSSLQVRQVTIVQDFLPE